jgi:hypothetical protein
VAINDSIDLLADSTKLMSAHCRTDILWRSMIPQKIYLQLLLWSVDVVPQTSCTALSALGDKRVRRPQVGMNPAWFYFPAFISVFRIPWNAFDRAQVRMPGALFAAQRLSRRRRPSDAAEARRACRGFLSADYSAPAIDLRPRESVRRAAGGARSLRPESSGGPGKLAAALSDDRAPRKRPGSLVAAFSALAIERRRGSPPPAWPALLLSRCRQSTGAAEARRARRGFLGASNRGP